MSPIGQSLRVFTADPTKLLDTLLTLEHWRCSMEISQEEMHGRRWDKQSIQEKAEETLSGIR